MYYIYFEYEPLN